MKKKTGQKKNIPEHERRIRQIFSLFLVIMVLITGRIVYLQGIFPFTPLDEEKLRDKNVLSAYEVRAWEEKEDSKSRLRSFFTWLRKKTLSVEEENLYERRLSSRSKTYVHLMPFVRNKIDKVNHPFVTVRHDRGRIYSSDGVLLAVNDAAYDVAFRRSKFPTDMALRNEQIDKVLGILGVDRNYKMSNAKGALSIQARLDGNKKRIPLATATREQYEQIRKLRYDSVDMEYKLARTHPLGIAEDVLGVANYLGGDRGNPFVGLSGIEKSFDEYLVSRDEEIDRQEHPELVVSGTPENAPRDVYVTIDRNIQEAAQDIMSEWGRKIRSDLGMLIVQECDTGRILAMASTKPKPGQNVFAENAYEPGSTLKTITFAALVDSKAATEDTPVEVGRYGKAVGWEWKRGKVIHDDHDSPNEPVLSLRRVIEVSSNIGTAKLARNVLGAERLYKYLEAFGFGRKTGIELPIESSGLMFPLKKYKTDPSLVITSSYGHGISVTMIQLASAYSAMINGGVYHQPSLVDRVTMKDGRLDYLPEREEPRRVISEESSAKVRKVLRGVMENGTGKEGKIKGYILAGKTGTANRVSGKGYKDKSANSFFAGFFPYKNPKYTIIAAFDNPEREYRYGSKAAMPVYVEMVQKLIEMNHIPKDN